MAPANKREQIEDYLKQIAEGVSGRARVIVNADGTIDGEVFAPIEYGESLETKFENVQDTIRENRPAGTFVCAGFRFEPSARVPTKADYNRHRGLYQVFSNYYRNPPNAIDVVRDMVVGEKGMRKKGYRKPVHLIYRVHWNRYGVKPPREGGK